jgi:PAS domain S-box-containing protein
MEAKYMAGKNILIADDDPGVLNLLEEMLQYEGYYVFPASNGKEAVETAQNRSVDIAILDIKMPLMDGIEALKRIKEIDRNIEVLIMTSYAELESLRQTVVDYGAFDYLLKPFHKDEIMQTIRNAMSKRELISQNEFLDKELKNRIFQLEKDFEERTRQLRESQIKYKEIIENSNDIIVVAQDGKLKFANPKTLELTGYTHEEILDIPFLELIHPEDRSMVSERHMRRLQGEDVPSTYSFRLIKKNKEAFWVETNAVRTMWEGRAATLNFIRDVTEKRKMEAQLQQAKKMEAIGTLAGGIAHDFNNLLMGIQGRISLMLMDTDSSYPHFKHLKGIEAYVVSAADLAKKLLGFARGGKYEVKPSDLNEIIRNSSEMFGRTRKEMRIHPKYQRDIWTVNVDQGQIEQVLMNLFVNAWQAMPGGGNLYIETKNCKLDENYFQGFKFEPGNYLKISITDTGMGMDEATQHRIFEPFFTTKEMGRGTGLGLASAYGIIKNHGGVITVESKKGAGTTFYIYLPASETKIVEEKKLHREVLKGTETILLVDDEDMIIDVGEQLLETMGYKVIISRGGKEAIDVYRSNKDRIDMVVLDMVMPGMGGGEAYDKMKEINPNIKVLLSSGYSIDGQATEILQRGCDGFIQKPFNLKALSQKLREILDTK